MQHSQLNATPYLRILDVCGSSLAFWGLWFVAVSFVILHKSLRWGLVGIWAVEFFLWNGPDSGPTKPGSVPTDICTTTLVPTPHTLTLSTCLDVSSLFLRQFRHSLSLHCWVPLSGALFLQTYHISCLLLCWTSFLKIHFFHNPSLSRPFLWNMPSISTHAPGTSCPTFIFSFL